MLILNPRKSPVLGLLCLRIVEGGEALRRVEFTNSMSEIFVAEELTYPLPPYFQHGCTKADDDGFSQVFIIYDDEDG